MNLTREQAIATTVIFPLFAAGTTNRISGATLAAGDFKLLLHTGGVWTIANPATATPTEIGTSGMYALPLTALELTPDDLKYEVAVVGHDVAGAEWADLDISIQVVSGRVDVGEWLGSVPNALISGRLDVNAQVVADKVEYTLTNGEHVQVAVDVLDAVASSHNIAGSIGEKINTSGAVADPWTTAVPGAYGAGTAGYILGNVGSAVDPWNTTVPGAYAVGKAGYIVGTYLDAKVGDVKAQTDKLQFDVSNYIKSDPLVDSPGTTTLLGRLTVARAGYLDLLNAYLDLAITSIRTIVNAIKAKTDLLPAAPASETLLEAAISASQSAIIVQTDLIKAKTNTIPASPAAVGSQMDLVNAPNVTAVAAIQSGLATGANQTTILARLGAWTGTGRNTLLGAIQALFRKDVDATVPTDVNTDLGSGAGTADNTTDSTQAIRDNMSSGGVVPSAEDNADAVWNALRSTHVVAGSFGEGVASVQGNVSGSVNSVTGAVGSVTGGVGGNVTGSVGSVLGSIGGAVPDSAGVVTLLARLSSLRAGYLDMLAGWSGTLLTALRALARKDVGASADLGGTHLPSTDSEEALSEKIDTLVPAGATTENVTVNELNT